ncbi:uncharacterized protein BcabD6B2_34390 [Babesia caballi]|uniref:Membrane protein, putative n=1 Tax=Babesia caballi TaxID=5871 RepID=A0AAV4LZQ5_BABCB|nr:membrane protein, putative [Babesia caballi]
MLAASLILACQALAASCFAAQTEDARKYEAQYDTTLVPLVPDETYRERLSRLAFGSCQDFDFGDNRIFPVINSTDPDLFLYTGDIIYPDIGCCTPDCIIAKYEKLNANAEFQEFRSKLRRMDGIYDDHDFGIDDGHSNFPYRAESQRLLMDFLQKPEDHYRRKREGAYFSMEYEDPENEHHRVKIIVLDVRYHRDCYYYCPCLRCQWTTWDFLESVTKRSMSYYFGLGCDQPGDMLGEEQWRWLQGQLFHSKAETHVIVSPLQVFTTSSLLESWGLLPHAKERLANLLIATKPKNPIFISGDVHWGEIMEKDGIVEITASSLTHSFLLEFPMLRFPLYFLVPFWGKKLYGYNNFGIIDFGMNGETGEMRHHIKLLDDAGKIVFEVIDDGTTDPMLPYLDVKNKPSTFLHNTRIIPCRSFFSKFTLGILFVLVGIPALILFIIAWMIWRIIYTISGKYPSRTPKPKKD